MLFVIEIVLTISAWRNGLQGWVVLPLLALFLGGAGASEEEAFSIGFAYDIILIIALGIMAGTWLCCVLAPSGIRLRRACFGDVKISTLDRITQCIHELFPTRHFANCIPAEVNLHNLKGNRLTPGFSVFFPDLGISERANEPRWRKMMFADMVVGPGNIRK
jgi:hypothetical protein